MILATRQSPLAMAQAHYVQAQLALLYPDCQTKLLPLLTEGDRRQDVSLSKIGGKGLFIKALEEALLQKKADAAVHSLKDLPATLPDGFSIVAVLNRQYPFDAFVSNRYAHIDDLPLGSVVGTSSIRRSAQLSLFYPELVVRPLRGNLATRLKKLDDGQFDALILASAGLHRLGLADRICHEMSIDTMLPAAGQGALAIEVHEANLQPILSQQLASLNDDKLSFCVAAERAFSEALGGGCHMPLAAYATYADDQIQLSVRLLDSGQHGLLETQKTACIASVEAAKKLGQEAADTLFELGAQAILDRLNNQG